MNENLDLTEVTDPAHRILEMGRLLYSLENNRFYLTCGEGSGCGKKHESMADFIRAHIPGVSPDENLLERWKDYYFRLCHIPELPTDSFVGVDVELAYAARNHLTRRRTLRILEDAKKVTRGEMARKAFLAKYLPTNPTEGADG